MRFLAVAALGAASLPAMTAASCAADAGPMATTAKVEVQGDKGSDLALNKSEQVAFMFVADIAQVEQDCTVGLNRPCTMDEVVNGGLKMSNGMTTQGLRYDPRKTDPDYTFTLITSPTAWSLDAAPKKKGMVGFYKEPNFTGTIHYNLTGEAGWQDPATSMSSIEGDSFVRP